MSDYIAEKDRLKAKIKALLVAKDFSRDDAIELAADLFAAAQLRDADDVPFVVEG